MSKAHKIKNEHSIFVCRVNLYGFHLTVLGDFSFNYSYKTISKMMIMSKKRTKKSFLFIRITSNQFWRFTQLSNVPNALYTFKKI